MLKSLSEPLPACLIHGLSVTIYKTPILKLQHRLEVCSNYTGSPCPACKESQGSFCSPTSTLGFSNGVQNANRLAGYCRITISIHKIEQTSNKVSLEHKHHCTFLNWISFFHRSLFVGFDIVKTSSSPKKWGPFCVCVCVAKATRHGLRSTNHHRHL